MHGFMDSSGWQRSGQVRWVGVWCSQHEQRQCGDGTDGFHHFMVTQVGASYLKRIDKQPIEV